MVLVDTHAHINFAKFKDDLDATIAKAFNADVKYILNIGTDLKTTQESVALAKKYEAVYAAAGIHPTDAAELDIDEAVNAIEAFLREDKVVAIGEVGLDYYHDAASHEEQKKLLRAFIKLQKKASLPLILHVRDAYEDFFSILNDEYGDGPVKGVVHCFSGNKDHLKKALDLGLYVSITGPVTYKKSDELREIAYLIPDEKLLLETDCPFLAPQKYRGQRNEPAYIRDLAEYIAELRGISLDDIARITTVNSNKLFGFPDVDLSPKAVYKIRDSIYVNVTQSCSNACVFCVKFRDQLVKGYNLHLDKDPDAQTVIKEIRAYGGKDRKVVFCGLGEPFLRLDFIKEVATEIKKDGCTVRVDTNGHGALINKRNVLPELKGLVDSLCVSLNAPNAELYNKICTPAFEGNVFEAVCDFIREAKKYVPDVMVSYVDLPDVEPLAMEKLVAELGADLRVRHYDVVG